jgi:hypothetical protein
MLLDRIACHPRRSEVQYSQCAICNELTTNFVLLYQRLDHILYVIACGHLPVLELILDKCDYRIVNHPLLF